MINPQLEAETHVLTTLREQVVARAFYLQDTMQCLEQCIGKIIVTETEGVLTAARIVEAEAYRGNSDKAAHSYGGRHTKRTHIQFGIGGHAYIFSIHTHTQFCFVTGEENVNEVILIRGVEPMVGITIMERRRQKFNAPSELGNGPGKLCASLGIHKGLYGNDLTIPNELWLADDGTRFLPAEIVQAKRVGIDYAEECKDVLWRYYVKGSPFISKK